MKKTIRNITLTLILCAVLTSCGSETSSSEKTTEQTTASTAAVTEEEKTTEVSVKEIDYMVLVNKLNALPDDWEKQLDTKTFKNSVGDDVEVETSAYSAYLELKSELEEEGIYVDLDSARRSVAAQQQIMDSFTEKYGADYAAKTVAEPGHSEHHTGLALDLYLIIDGKDITLNEEMIKYPEIWAKIHEKLASHGFILRYLEGREHITGYGYEPWHIRYIGDPAAAEKIMSDDLTLEEYLGAVEKDEAVIDYGRSESFTEEELREAAVQVKCKFASFPGCNLVNLRYAGDESSNEENLARIKEKDGSTDYSQVIEFLSDFRTDDKSVIFEPDSEIRDYQWWLAREEGGGWQLIDWGY